MLNKSVYVNNFDLATVNGVKIVDYNISELPSRNLNVSKLARANKSVLTSAEYARKTVSVDGFVGGANWQEQQDNFDALKARIQSPDSIIRFEQGTKTVEYTGTLNGILKNRIGLNLSFTLMFLCADPIGLESGATTLLATTAITTATSTIDITVGGSSTARPRFTATVNSLTGGTDKSISILNAFTGKGIKITRTWTAGDILTVSSDIYEVQVNNVTVDFSGQFPVWEPGTKQIQYIDDFTTRDVDISATYNKAYS